MDRIPQCPNQLLLLQQGKWITNTNRDWGDHFYHIHSANNTDIWANIYIRDPQHRQLTLVTEEAVPIPISAYQAARVYSITNNSISEFNPIKPQGTVWTYGSGRVSNLSWDPGEWSWQKT
jgi:hypothetical protein